MIPLAPQRRRDGRRSEAAHFAEGEQLDAGQAHTHAPADTADRHQRAALRLQFAADIDVTVEAF
jgi:hypothetical protein